MRFRRPQPALPAGDIVAQVRRWTHGKTDARATANEPRRALKARRKSRHRGKSARSR